MTRLLPLTRWILLLLVAFSPFSVLAKEPHGEILDSTALIASELARQHYQNGVRLFENGLFEAARVEFEASYRHSGEPDLLWNLSLTAERLGKYADALEFAERFQSAKRLTMSAADSAEVQAKIEHLQRRVAAPSRRAKRHRAIAISLISFGGLSLAVSVGCGIGALSAKQTLELGGLFQSEYEAIVSRGQALNGATIGLGIAGVLSVGGGVALLLLGGQS